MSIRLKLIIAYFVMIVVSVVILIFGFIGTTTKMVSELAENALGESTFEEVATSAMNVLVDIEYMIRYEPELFNDPDHMASVEANVSEMNMSMFVENQGAFVYTSVYREDIQLSEFVGELEFDGGHRSEDSKNNFETADYTMENHYYIIGRHAINEGDMEGYVYVIYEAESRNQMHWTLYGGMYRVIFFVLIIILVFMTIVITRMIINPLNKLEDATVEITQGNLDFSVKTKKRDEFGRVMNAFDTMREELQNSINQQLLIEENRKELIASISHDLKTPITSIKGYVEGIRDGVANDEEKMNQYLEVIHYKSNDLDRLIDDLFLFSKLDLNRVPFDFKKVSAKRFFDDSSDEIRMDIEKKSFELNFDIQLDEASVINVDQQQFKRVISNIINNAVKYSEQNKRIDILVEEVDDNIRMGIRDYGKGISEEALEKIFEKFYRADPSRNADVGGSGLGLAIAKQIMDQHRGRIYAESVIGEGTTIYIEIGKV